ncbi:MAG: hypothetical protein BWY95_02633 [Bacteroidetes bacterium ADurb.BinA104]|nr:MAG: hypothetical protein BWY95_02633 [Bacteroidetes bacterium ADurb.BinA104]
MSGTSLLTGKLSDPVSGVIFEIGLFNLVGDITRNKQVPIFSHKDKEQAIDLQQDLMVIVLQREGSGA